VCNVSIKAALEQSYSQRDCTSHLQTVHLIPLAFLTTSIWRIAKHGERTHVVVILPSLSGILAFNITIEEEDVESFTQRVLLGFEVGDPLQIVAVEC